MSEQATPVIKDLEGRDAPCFLWDGARLRIVWANAAGLAVFAAETLFDLIDRPFHVTEPGAARIGELQPELASGTSRKELLSFPSTGRLDPMAFTCFQHPLPDGRPGILLVGERAASGRWPGLSEEMAQAFDALPVAAILLEADGAISQHNRAAEDFLGHLEEHTLAALFADAAAAADFIQRLRNAGRLGQVRPLALPIGRREVRLVAGMLDGPFGGGERFVITLEDVTERRALERSLSVRPRDRATGGVKERQVKPEIAPPSVSRAETAAAAPTPPAAAPQRAAEMEKTRETTAAAPAAPEDWRPDDRELRAILDTASDGIVMLDAQGDIRSFSAGAEALFGKLKADVIGQPFEELLTAETRKTFRDYLSGMADSGMASVFNDGREVEAVAGPGGSLPLFLTLTRFKADRNARSNAEQAFCAVVRDITQWKKTEAELRQAKDEAERTSSQKSEFLARISHELRTPLNAILGFSEVMRLERFGRIQNEKYRSYVDDIHTSGGHLLSLINDLLDLSKVEAGKLELDFTSVDLSEVTDQAIRTLAEQAQRSRVVLRKNIPADLPSVVADARSTRQIMLNLLSNGVKFTDPGGQVTVSARLTKAGELVLRVKDTGVGMNEEELKDALEPFRRVISDARGNVEGTGLGLPLTKALTEANRAQFSISSQPGKGTMVEITFPTTRVLAD